MGLTIFLLVVGLLAGLLYLLVIRRGSSPEAHERGRDKDERHLGPW
jgi:hypothetical protein